MITNCLKRVASFHTMKQWDIKGKEIVIYLIIKFIYSPPRIPELKILRYIAIKNDKNKIIIAQVWPYFFQFNFFSTIIIVHIDRKKILFYIWNRVVVFEDYSGSILRKSNYFFMLLVLFCWPFLFSFSRTNRGTWNFASILVFQTLYEFTWIIVIIFIIVIILMTWCRKSDFPYWQWKSWKSRQVAVAQLWSLPVTLCTRV